MINSDMREKIIDYFWEELESWDYDSWTSSSSSDKEDMVKGVILELELPSELEEEVYELFYDWSDGIDEDSFMD
jgi:hypothetical protein